MRLGDVEIGEPYYYHGGQIIAEEIEMTDLEKGSHFSGVICRLASKADRRLKAEARHMIPWREHQAARRLRRAEDESAQERLREIREIIGEGVEPQGGISRDFAYLFLTEAAAEKTLKICGAKPIPEDRRPSLAQDEREWARRATLLGQRVRRALGAGYAGAHGGHTLLSRGKRFEAQIFFSGDDLEVALNKLEGRNAQPSSTLTELIG